MGLLLITRFTLQEALRKRLLLAIILLTLILLAVYSFLLKIVIDTSIPAMANQGYYTQFALLAAGIFISVPLIWLVYLMSGILTIFLSAGMISAEVEASTLAIIIPKPLRRYEIVLGKWLGHAIILGIYIALLLFAFLAVLYWQTGYWPDQYLNVLALLELAMLALLGMTTLGSTLVPTIVNGAIALILFIGAPITGFITTILDLSSTTSQNVPPPTSDTVQNITTIINLIIPTDALWHGASYYLVPSSALTLLTTQDFSSALFNLPILNAQPLPTALLIWVLLYCLALPALATWRFHHRDL